MTRDEFEAVLTDIGINQTTFAALTGLDRDDDHRSHPFAGPYGLRQDVALFDAGRRRGPVDAHHQAKTDGDRSWTPEPKAHSLKAGDNWTVPLCHALHHGPRRATACI